MDFSPSFLVARSGEEASGKEGGEMQLGRWSGKTSVDHTHVNQSGLAQSAGRLQLPISAMVDSGSILNGCYSNIQSWDSEKKWCYM